MLPASPPPPPWAGAAPPQGPASQVAPWAVASERLNTFTTSGLVDTEVRMTPVARLAVAMPGVYYLVNLIVQRVNADQLRCARPPDEDHLGLLPARPDGAALPRPQRVQSRQPPRRTRHAGCGRRGVHLAAPGRLGRPGARHSVPPLPGLGCRRVVRAGRQPVGALLRHPRLPAAGRPAQAAGAAVVDRLARGGLRKRGGRHRARCSPPARRWWCPSRRHWPAWPSSPGHRASSARSPPPTGSSRRARPWKRERSGADRAPEIDTTSGPIQSLSNGSPGDCAPVAGRSLGLATFQVVGDGESTEIRGDPVTTDVQIRYRRGAQVPRSRCVPPRCVMQSVDLRLGFSGRVVLSDLNVD